MAAYGALVSVMQIMDQIQRHPHPPITLDEKQSKSLTANVSFLQEFLEGYNPHRTYTSEADGLESRIVEAAYAAEDVIESYIVDQIHARSTDDSGKISSTEFYQGLEKVIEEIDLIKMEIKEKMNEKKIQGVQIIKKQPTTDAAVSSRSSSSTAQKVGMVGLDDVLYDMLDKITGGERVRQIIPIVGMGGLGKTTLARNIYINPLVKEHFDICAWSTISQVHNAPKILTEILGQVHNGEDLSEGELGVSLYKCLIGKRYLIVMDDMWSIEAWDKIRSFFPDNGNGSRVLVTTRLSNLASMFNYSDGLDMKFLDEASSWNLFSKTVFGDKSCPPELEDVGKKIVEGCRGLPLSIVVIGGLLSKSEATRENWQVIEENLSSVVNLEDDGSCLQILFTSYNNLPIHLKPCFLYMATFPEDSQIVVCFLIRQWIAEGFIKPIEGKSLEEATEEYLEELVDRNLVLVEERDSCGDLERLKIHDLLRDLCLREAGKDRFLCVLGEQSIHDHLEQGISCQRRITGKLMGDALILQSLESASLVRSFTGDFPSTLSSSFKLSRVCMADDEIESSLDSEQIYVPQVNLRLLFADARTLPLLTTPCSPLYDLWNLHTLVLSHVTDGRIVEIRRLPLLRYVMTFGGPLRGSYCLPYCKPISDDDDDDGDKDKVVLENLHTLGQVENLQLAAGVLRTIPNIKMLILFYTIKKRSEYYYCLYNLHRLNKLQDLHLTIRKERDSPPVQAFTLPDSLKQLTLKGTKLPWEEMTSKIGCLPLLQVLKLKERAFIGSEWETVEGQFSSLKFLKIEKCDDLEQWITDDNTHFPRLEHLVLSGLNMLREIPSSIGDIPTLRSIDLEYCGDCVVESARRILEEQEDLGNQDLQIQVMSDSSNSEFVTLETFK